MMMQKNEQEIQILSNHDLICFESTIQLLSVQDSSHIGKCRLLALLLLLHVKGLMDKYKTCMQLLPLEVR